MLQCSNNQKKHIQIYQLITITIVFFFHFKSSRISRFRLRRMAVTSIAVRKHSETPFISQLIGTELDQINAAITPLHGYDNIAIQFRRDNINCDDMLLEFSQNPVL